MPKVKSFILNNKYPLTLLVLPLLVFWRDLIPIPGRVFIGNDAILSFNTLASIVYQLRDGIIPFWDPHTFFGIPLLTRPDSLVFYPPFGILVLVSSLFRLSISTIYTLMELVTIFHYSLAGIGTYLLLKKLKLSDFSAFIGGLIYMLNAGIIAYASTTALQTSMSLLPIILIVFDNLIRKPTFRRLSIFSLVFALPVITFSWTSAITYHSAFLFFYFLYLFFTKEISSFWKSGFYAFLGFILAAFISAVVILPGLEVPVISTRADVSYSSSAFSGNLLPRQLIDFFLPYLNATNYGEAETLHLFPGTNPLTYVGILPWFLVIPSFFKTRHRLQPFFFLAFLDILLFTLGGNTPVFGLIYLIFFPLMRAFTEHRLALYLAQFCLAIVAAFGLENICIDYPIFKEKIIRYRGRLTSLFKLLLLVSLVIFFRYDQLIWNPFPPGSPPTQYFSSLNVLVVFIIIYGFSLSCLYLIDSNKMNNFRAAVFLVLFFDLFLFAEKYPVNNIGVDPSKLLSNNEVIKYITKENDRFFYRSDVGELPHNYASALFKINHVVGYLVYTNKITFSFNEILRRVPRNQVADTVSAVRYIVTESEIKLNGYKDVFDHTVTTLNQPNHFHLGVAGWEPVPVGTKIRVYENMSFFPFPIFVSKVTPADDIKAKDLISNQQINPRQEAVIYDLQSELISPQLLNGVATLSASQSVSVLSDKNNEKKYSTSSSRAGFLVTTLPYYPDWKVQIDGVEKEVIRTNLAFLGIEVPAGNHVVRFYYRPALFLAGFIISIISLIFSIALIVLGGSREVLVETTKTPI